VCSSGKKQSCQQSQHTSTVCDCLDTCRKQRTLLEAIVDPRMHSMLCMSKLHVLFTIFGCAPSAPYPSSRGWRYAALGGRVVPYDMQAGGWRMNQHKQHIPGERFCFLTTDTSLCLVQ
jgi:hypothetical protein